MKQFSAILTAAESLPFEVSGTYVADADPLTVIGTIYKFGDPWTEKFFTLPNPPTRAVVSLASAQIQIPDAGGDPQIGLVARFVGSCLMPTDENRWFAMVNDEHRVVEAAAVREIARWLEQEFIGRPLVRSEDS